MVCSHKEDGALIYDLLPARWRRRNPALSSVGRLDKDSSGLLLLTDDGQLLHRLISPKQKVGKTYLVTLDRPLEASTAGIFASGTLMLDNENKPLLPASLTALDTHRAQITIYEGRYHQVRRMFAAVGNHVTGLHRSQFGGLALPQDVAEGAFRPLTQDELEALESPAASTLPT